MNIHNLQYISDEQGHPISVIIPIEQWQEILAQHERVQLLQQPPSIAELFDELEAIEENTELEFLTRSDRTNPMEYW
jgi:hypothetical protein